MPSTASYLLPVGSIGFSAALGLKGMHLLVQAKEQAERRLAAACPPVASRSDWKLQAAFQTRLGQHAGRCGGGNQALRITCTAAASTTLPLCTNGRPDGARPQTAASALTAGASPVLAVPPTRHQSLQHGSTAHGACVECRGGFAASRRPAQGDGSLGWVGCWGLSLGENGPGHAAGSRRRMRGACSRGKHGSCAHCSSLRQPARRIIRQPVAAQAGSSVQASLLQQPADPQLDGAR